jgi:hypothetical protein
MRPVNSTEALSLSWSVRQFAWINGVATASSMVSKLTALEGQFD